MSLPHLGEGNSHLSIVYIEKLNSDEVKSYWEWWQKEPQIESLVQRENSDLSDMVALVDENGFNLEPSSDWRSQGRADKQNTRQQG